MGVSPLSTRGKCNSDDRDIILDLSFPQGASVNDWTPKDSYLGWPINLTYPTVDDLAKRVHSLGPLCLIFKCDMTRAFFQLPLDPFDYGLFCFSWEGMYFFSLVLVMGHRVALYICQHVTSAISYIHSRAGWFLLNYIDDFVGAELQQRAHQSYRDLGKLMQDIGAQEALHKAVSPSPRVEFLGVLFDAKKGIIEVTPDRLQELVQETGCWFTKTVCTRKELEQLIGKLQFVAACICPRRVFISCMLNQL